MPHRTSRLTHPPLHHLRPRPSTAQQPSNTPVQPSASIALGNCLAQLLSTGWLVRKAARDKLDGCCVTLSLSIQFQVPAAVLAPRDSGRTQAWEFSTIPSQQTWAILSPSTVSISSPTTCPANCPVNKFATCRSCSVCLLSTASSPFFALLMPPTGRGNSLHLVVLSRELYCRRDNRCRLFHHQQPSSRSSALIIILSPAYRLTTPFFLSPNVKAHPRKMLGSSWPRRWRLGHKTTLRSHYSAARKRQDLFGMTKLSTL